MFKPYELPKLMQQRLLLMVDLTCTFVPRRHYEIKHHAMHVLSSTFIEIADKNMPKVPTQIVSEKSAFSVFTDANIRFAKKTKPSEAKSGTKFYFSMCCE